MQEEKYRDFDLQIRSMMQDAEEEVPSRVWDAVSSRISHQKVMSLWWRRTAVAVAAAAAVAVGVFFSTWHKQPSMGGSGAEGLLAVVPATDDAVTDDIAVLDGQETELVALAQSEDIVDITVPVSTGVLVGEDLSDIVSSSEIGRASSAEAETAEDASTLADERQNAVVAKASGRNNKANIETKQSESAYDPFALMAYEDAYKHSNRKKVSGFIEGNVTSNERGDVSSSRLSAPASGAPSKTGIAEKSLSTYGIPLSFGVGARYRFSEKLSVSAGLNYSLLSRSFTGLYTEIGENGAIKRSINADVQNNLHYIGIPVNLYYDVLQSNKISFYAFAGGTVEKGIVNKFRIYSQPNIIHTESVSGVQLSAAVGLGIEFALSDNVGLYVDPSARYYFECKQPHSVRTQKPFMLNFEVGLRFKYK